MRNKLLIKSLNNNNGKFVFLQKGIRGMMSYELEIIYK